MGGGLDSKPWNINNKFKCATINMKAVSYPVPLLLLTAARTNQQNRVNLHHIKDVNCQHDIL